MVIIYLRFFTRCIYYFVNSCFLYQISIKRSVRTIIIDGTGTPESTPTCLDKNWDFFARSLRSAWINFGNFWQNATSKNRIKIVSHDIGLKTVWTKIRVQKGNWTRVHYITRNTSSTKLTTAPYCSEHCSIIGRRRTRNISRGPWVFLKNISDAIKAFKKRKKSAANTQADSDDEDCDEE